MSWFAPRLVSTGSLIRCVNTWSVNSQPCDATQGPHMPIRTTTTLPIEMLQILGQHHIHISGTPGAYPTLNVVLLMFVLCYETLSVHDKL